MEYARYADDLVVLVDGYRTKWEWLLKEAYRRLLLELARIDVKVNTEKTRLVDLAKGETFSFLGFDYRRGKTKSGKWGVRLTPRMKARTKLLQNLKDVFRRHVSQPVDQVIALDQSEAPGLGELLQDRTCEPLFLLRQVLGREEGEATPPEGAESVGLRLEQVEYGMAV